MTEALKHILKQRTYSLISISSSLVAIVILVGIANTSLIFPTFFRGDFSLSLKWIALKSLIENFPLSAWITTIILAVLLGINIATLTYYARNKIAAFRIHSGATSFFGILVGILGVGCAACGSFVLMSVIPFFGGGALLSLLPLGGQEFAIAGILLLIISLILTLREIINPAVCTISS